MSPLNVKTLIISSEDPVFIAQSAAGHCDLGAEKMRKFSQNTKRLRFPALDLPLPPWQLGIVLERDLFLLRTRKTIQRGNSIQFHCLRNEVRSGVS